jgi:hypothetical protein
MTSAADEPVESGQVYTVIDVDGKEPESLDDFAGDIHLILGRNDLRLHVVGAGNRSGDSVRFYQKGLTLHDRDIRVWGITEAGDTTFVAAPLAAF